METATTAEVAKRVRQDIERISNVSAVARESGIAYVTLQRRLMDGNFKLSELIAVGNTLRTDPREYLRPTVEHSSAA